MMKRPTKNSIRPAGENLWSEFLILPDGRILAHNLTRPGAELLHKLSPDDGQIALRMKHHASTNHELPD